MRTDEFRFPGLKIETCDTPLKVLKSGVATNKSVP